MQENYQQTKPNQTAAWFRSLIHHPARKCIGPTLQLRRPEHSQTESICCNQSANCAYEATIAATYKCYSANWRRDTATKSVLWRFVIELSIQQVTRVIHRHVVTAVHRLASNDSSNSNRQLLLQASSAFCQSSSTTRPSTQSLHIWSSEFSVAGPAAWNCLCDELREPLLTANSFRQLLNTCLVADY